MPDPGDPWGIIEDRAAIVQPPGAVIIEAGVDDPQTVIDSNPPGTTYWYDGIFAMSYDIIPKNGDTHLTNNAVLDGGAHWLVGDESIRGSVLAPGPQSGFALKVGAGITGVTIRGFEIRYYALRGIQPWIGSQLDHLLIHHCYRNGIGGGFEHAPWNGGASPQSIVEDCIIWDCGSANELGSGAGGIKQAATGDAPAFEDTGVLVLATPGSGVTYRRVYTWRNYGNGIWHDVACGGDIIDDVVARECGRKGVYIEVSTGPVEITNVTSEGNVTWIGEDEPRPHSADCGIGAGTSLYVTIDNCRVGGQVGKPDGILLDKAGNREARFGHGTDFITITNNYLYDGDTIDIKDPVFEGIYPATDITQSNNADPSANGASYTGIFDPDLIDDTPTPPDPPIPELTRVQFVTASAVGGAHCAVTMPTPQFGSTLLAYVGAGTVTDPFIVGPDGWTKDVSFNGSSQSAAIWKIVYESAPEDEETSETVTFTWQNTSGSGLLHVIIAEYVSPGGPLERADHTVVSEDATTDLVIPTVDVPEVEGLFFGGVTLGNTSDGFNAPSDGFATIAASPSSRTLAVDYIEDTTPGRYGTTLSWASARNAAALLASYVPSTLVIPGEVERSVAVSSTPAVEVVRSVERTRTVVVSSVPAISVQPEFEGEFTTTGWGGPWGIVPWGGTLVLPPEPPGHALDGLTGQGALTYREALVGSHATRVLIDVYGRNEQLKGPLRAAVIAGQVDADISADITRTLSLTIADPRRRMAWDPHGQLFADDFISVSRGVWVSGLEMWVDVPVFYGPVSRMERDGSEVTIEAVGKEALLMPPRPYTFPKDPLTVVGRKLRDYVRHQAASMGETRFRLGALGGAKISKGEAAFAAKARDEGLWAYLKRLTQANGFDLYYAPDGELTARRQRGRVAWTFTDGTEGTLLGEPSVSYDLSELRNVVVVKGKDSHGKNVTRATARLAANHPLSPEGLAWGGEDRVLREVIRFDHEIIARRAAEVADNHLRRASATPVEVSFEALVIPHLELGDRCELESSTNPHAVRFTLDRITIPLSADESMSVGYTKPANFAPYRRRIRKHRGKARRG